MSALRTIRGAAAALAVAVMTLRPVARPVSAGQDDPVSPQVQSAVDRGLEWLAQKQDSRTGEWPTGMGRSTAITSLCVMSLLARGHVPDQGRYGDTINRGIDYVLSQQQPDSGVLASDTIRQNMYDHGIATTMLCEVYGMVDEKRQASIKKAVAKAVRVILNAQNVRKNSGDQGGWRYQPTSNDSDISVTGWQLMALRGAANIGANVPHRAIEDGIAYIKNRAVQTGGFSYNGMSDANAARTGTGILSLELLGQHHTKEALAGGAYLMANPIGGGRGGLMAEHYFYSVYYCSQAANQLGGNYFDAIYKPIVDSLLQHQRKDGSWTAAQTNEQQGGDTYATAMALLALEVPYRYLPLYQR